MQTARTLRTPENYNHNISDEFPAASADATGGTAISNGQMASEKFCLRWNDFESNISGAFRELRDDKDFFDVTLACEDEQIQAHKVAII